MRFFVVCQRPLNLLPFSRSLLEGGVVDGDADEADRDRSSRVLILFISSELRRLAAAEKREQKIKKFQKKKKKLLSYYLLLMVSALSIALLPNHQMATFVQVLEDLLRLEKSA